MKLLAVDGNSIINRAFYGIRLLSTKNGEYTNAVYGFINIFNKIVASENPDAVAVAFDRKSPTFRHEKYAAYKAGRHAMPDELFSQMPLLKEWLKLAGYATVEKDGFEADDILGTLSAAADQNGDSCIILTGDRDALQLVNENVNVVLAVTRSGGAEYTKMDENAVKEKYGIPPKGLIELKAIWGDASDNIPGVSGIGEKGATELIKKFSTVDNIYKNIDSEDIKDSIRQKLIAGKESAYLSRFLGEICLTAPVDTNLEHYKIGERDKELGAFMARLELFSLMKSMGVQNSGEASVKEKKEALEPLVFSQVSPEDFKADSFCAYFKDSSILLLSGDSFAVFNTSGLINDLPDLLSVFENAKSVSAFDTKTLYKFLKENGAKLKNVTFDTCLAAYLLNPNASLYDIDRLKSEYPTPPFKADSEDPFINEGILNALLSSVLKEKLSEAGQSDLLTDIEIPLAFVLGDMELVGFKVDGVGIKNFGVKLEKEIEEIRNQIFSLIGYEFNLNSPKQLGEALFEKLGLPFKKKTKSGYSTNAEVLESLKDSHPVIELLLSYRSKAKLKSTYCDSLINKIAADGRIHSTFNQTETRTGRISSLEPNLQNIPVRQKEGKELRKFFVADEGRVLCDADYSQIELRVLASMADEKNMIECFENGIDIHTLTASKAFNMPIDFITKELRSRAKAVNFGIIYGIGAFSLAKDIGVTRSEAANYINSYLAAYPNIEKFMDTAVSSAKEKGYVTTLFGRRRYLPEIKSSNKMLASFGERVARNAPIQGTAADIIKIAMINVHKRLKKENLDAFLILQVHDELIAECEKSIAKKVCDILKEEMENAVTLKVKLSVEAAFGNTWYEAKR